MGILHSLWRIGVGVGADGFAEVDRGVTIAVFCNGRQGNAGVGNFTAAFLESQLNARRIRFECRFGQLFLIDGFDCEQQNHSAPLPNSEQVLNIFRIWGS